MSLLALLTARVTAAFRAPLPALTEVTTPTSVRLPPEVRAELQRVADELDLSVNQVVVMVLRAYTEADRLTVQVRLMCARLRHLAQSYRLDVVAMQAIEPALTPDVLADDTLLARALTPDLIERVSERLMLNPGWLAGQSGGVGYTRWYSTPESVLAFVREHGVGNVVVYWTAAAAAPWLSVPADDDERQQGTPEEQAEREYLGHLGLFVSVQHPGSPHVLYRAWTPDSMTYIKSRLVARAIVIRLHEVGVRQVGLGIRQAHYRGLNDGTLLPIDLIRQGGTVTWPVGDTLLLGQGLYQHEDTWLGDVLARL